MPIVQTIISGKYLDSVKLMLISREIRNKKGVSDAVAITASPENKAILKNTGMFTEKFSRASANDICIAVKGDNQAFLQKVLQEAEEWIHKGLPGSSGKENDSIRPRNLKGALGKMRDANCVLISVTGRYAAQEARKALDNNLHVMLFSDNVSLEDEVKLKKEAVSKNLLMMGPDCGSAIINGVPLAFANAVRRGRIGIVSAAGTGLQEVSCVIHNEGQGISQAFGTGGRDGRKEVDGLMMLMCLQYLMDDTNTDVIVLVCKLPDQEVVNKIWELLKKTAKPVVVNFLQPIDASPAQHIYCTDSLAQSGFIATRLLENGKKEEVIPVSSPIRLAENSKRRYLRGLYSGGTLCYEAQRAFYQERGFYPWSNIPLKPESKLRDPWKSRENTFIDMGADEFTVARPHPMIDYTLRLKKMEEESRDPQTAIILFDVVLGYGAHPAPHQELAPVLKNITEKSDITLICSVVGTDNDPQDCQAVIETIEECGCIVTRTNIEAAKMAAAVIREGVS